MGQIFVEFDNTLKQSEIVVPLVASSKEEAGDAVENNKVEIQQTSVFGIQSPLIAIDNIVIDFNDISYFSLKSDGVLPELSMIVLDKYDLISSIDTPGMDNEVRVQILPQFDNAYKKIDLTFYIDNMNVRGDQIIEFNCTYKSPKFTGTVYKAFGKLCTYDLFKTICTETGLGFATNVARSEDDMRYIYCNYKSYKSLLDNEIDFSGCGELNIMDYWVDYWNNLTLANMYDRYTSIDNDDDMKVWISSQPQEINEDVKVEPTLVVANLNNHPMYANSELAVLDYSIVTNSGVQAEDGSDRIYTIYNMTNEEHLDYFVQDGDVTNDIFVKYDYIGECYGQYNYLLQRCFRKAFMQKINSESVKITLGTPLLGLMRGSKVNFTGYVDDSRIETKFEVLEEQGYIDGMPQTNIPYDDSETPDEQPLDDNGTFTVDRQVSGQYVITACDIKYDGEQWLYELILNRPADQKAKFINEEFKK